MADLDDFFAKKDKKKKGKKAFSKANTEVLAKNLEENDRKEQQAEEKATDIIQRGSRPIEDQAGTKENEAEEWAEYEEKKLDYTNLKIDTLKLDEEPEPNEDGDDVNEDGEKVKKSKEGGPWSKLVASDSLDKDEDEEKTPEPAPKEETPQPVLPAGAVTKSSYVPPHLRNSSARSVRGPESMDGPQTGPTSGGPRGPRRPKHAPDISNEVYFPSLSAAMGTDDPAYKTGQANSNRGFEEVKSGASQSSYNSKANEAPKLATNNKFAALRD